VWTSNEKLIINLNTYNLNKGNCPFFPSFNPSLLVANLAQGGDGAGWMGVKKTGK